MYHCTQCLQCVWRTFSCARLRKKALLRLAEIQSQKAWLPVSKLPHSVPHSLQMPPSQHSTEPLQSHLNAQDLPTTLCPSRHCKPSAITVSHHAGECSWFAIEKQKEDVLKGLRLTCKFESLSRNVSFRCNDTGNPDIVPSNHAAATSWFNLQKKSLTSALLFVPPPTP